MKDKVFDPKQIYLGHNIPKEILPKITNQNQNGHMPKIMRPVFYSSYFPEMLNKKKTFLKICRKMSKQNILSLFFTSLLYNFTRI